MFFLFKKKPPFYQWKVEIRIQENELTNKKMRVLKGERVKISHIYRKYTRSSKNGDSLKHCSIQCILYTQSV